MKSVLCICDAGEVRSVAMAKVLRERGYFAVSGTYDNFMEYYCKDAIEGIENYLHFDRIVNMSESSIDHRTIEPNGFIGRDEWGDPNNEELLALCRGLADRLGLTKENSK